MRFAAAKLLRISVYFNSEKNTIHLQSRVIFVPKEGKNILGSVASNKNGDSVRFGVQPHGQRAKTLT